MISLGGSDSKYGTVAYKTVEVTDLGPKSNSVCQIANLPEPVYAHSATYTKNGLLVCGGNTFHDQSYQITNKCHILMSNRSWVPFNSFKQSRYYFSMTTLKEKVVTIGGLRAENSIEYLSLETESKWETKTLPFTVNYHCAVAINDSTIMIIGGAQDGKVFRHFNC